MVVGGPARPEGSSRNQGGPERSTHLLYRTTPPLGRSRDLRSQPQREYHQELASAFTTSTSRASKTAVDRREAGGAGLHFDRQVVADHRRCKIAEIGPTNRARERHALSAEPSFLNSLTIARSTRLPLSRDLRPPRHADISRAAAACSASREFKLLRVAHAARIRVA